jgi:hypothetical protein
MNTQQMIASHPEVRGSTNDVLLRAIDCAVECAQTCLACADACLAEPMVTELRQCIRLDLDCADACAAAAAIATRRTGSNETVLASMLETCSLACRLCADECARHASQHEHCRICADSCRRCETACRDAAGSIGATRQ